MWTKLKARLQPLWEQHFFLYRYCYRARTPKGKCKWVKEKRNKFISSSKSTGFLREPEMCFFMGNETGWHWNNSLSKPQCTGRIMHKDRLYPLHSPSIMKCCFTRPRCQCNVKKKKDTLWLCNCKKWASTFEKLWLQRTRGKPHKTLLFQAVILMPLRSLLAAFDSAITSSEFHLYAFM